MVSKIQLSHEKYTLVDDEDYEFLSKYYWRAWDSGVKARAVYYAVRQEGSVKKRKTFLMHRVIMNAQKGEEIDHINGDPLDNRKINLRKVTRRENAQNQHTTTYSKYIGVTYDKRPNIKSHWLARITFGSKTIHIGAFVKEEEAVKAYDKKLIENGLKPVNFSKVNYKKIVSGNIA
jgi:hypothetical protein